MFKKFNISQENLDNLLDKYEKDNDTNPDNKTVFSDLDLSNKIIQNRTLNQIDFNRSCMSNTKIEFCHFTNSNFRMVELDNSQISNCTFDHCDFTSSNFSSSFIINTNIINSCLAQAFLGYSNLTTIKLNNSDIYGSDFTGSILAGVDFTNCGFGNTTKLLARQLIYCHNIHKLKSYRPESAMAIGRTMMNKLIMEYYLLINKEK